MGEVKLILFIYHFSFPPVILPPNCISPLSETKSRNQ
jgi:hypothetical protein